MKKFISLLLTAMILITNISVSNVKAEKVEKVWKYVLTQDPDKDGNITWTGFTTDKAGEVLDEIQKISDGLNQQARPDRDYTLTLNADLVIPLDDRGSLKVLNLNRYNRNFKQLTIEGNNHTISAVDSTEEGACFITLDHIDSIDSGLYLKNLTLDGAVYGVNAVDGVNKYNLINGYNGQANIDLYNCTLKNAKVFALYSKNSQVNYKNKSQVNIKKSKIMNCGLKDQVYFGFQDERSLIIEESKFIKNHGSVNFSGFDEAKLINTKFIDNESDKQPTIEAFEGEKLIINGGLISGNKGSVGGIFDHQVKSILYENATIINNHGYTTGAIETLSNEFLIRNCNISSNEGKCFNGAISLGNPSYHGDIPTGTIENSIISKNISDNFGAILLRDYCNLTINNTVISENKAKENGGAITLISYPENANLTINGGKIINNYTDGYGGAIFTEEGSYDITGKSDEIRKKLSTWKPFQNITIDRDVEFSGNKAGQGYFNPPQNYKDFTNLKFAKFSLENKLVLPNKEGKWEHVRSLLNNYDIAYINKISTVVYDGNNGSSEVYVVPSKTELDNDNQMSDFTPIKEYTSTIKSNKETKFTNGDKYFTSWNTEANGSGTRYLPGDEAKVKGNLYLYAQWYDPGVILTLNENYRGGKITEKNVFRGDSFDEHLYKPRRRDHTFKGWSYNKKHLNKVHRDDIIEEPITVYAIWDEVEEEEEIKALKHKAYIFGYPDGTVRPNGEITRAEAAAMLARLLEIESIGSAEAPSFPDTPSDWYNKAINAVVQRDIMKGYPDGTFKPNDAITRAEFTQMISTIDNKPYGTAPFADVVGHWAERPIGSEYEARRIMGYPDGTFRPDAHITRCEAAVILNKIFERNFDAMSLLKCKNPQMIKYFIDLDASFWGYNDMVEATNTHEFVRRTMNRVAENWLLIK